jgi:hypothetical protein
MTSAEPALRLHRLLRQLETVCYGHAATALNCSGRAMSMALPQSAPSPVGSAAACRCMHTGSSGSAHASRPTDSHAVAERLLLRTSGRPAASSGAALLRWHTSSSLTGQAVQTSAAGPSEGGSGPRPASKPPPAAWQQARRLSLAANAVQPAAAGMPAGQYVSRFPPHTRQPWREPVGHPLGVQPPLQQPLPAVTPPPAVSAWQGVEVAGVVQRVTYRSQETGYCVLKLKVSFVVELVSSYE